MGMNKELIIQLGEQERDPFRHLYFEKDTKNDGRGLVCVDGMHGKWSFEWDRELSNRNINRHGFSFYLALHICDGYFYNCHYSWGVLYAGLLFTESKLGMVCIEGRHSRKKNLEKPLFRIMHAREEVLPRAFIGFPGGIEVLGLSDSELEGIHNRWSERRDSLQARTLWFYKKKYGRYPKRYLSVLTDAEKDSLVAKYYSEDWW